MENEKAHYLGLDWGATDVGVALAHAETGVAMGYMTLDNDEKLLTHLGEIIAKEEIGTVVIGIPLYINQKKGECKGEKLGQLLRTHFSIKIAYQNEMFTTKMAQANLIERGMKQVSKHDDEEAARMILQEWLGKQNKSQS